MCIRDSHKGSLWLFIKCMILHRYFTPTTNKTKLSTKMAPTKRALLISNVPKSWIFQAGTYLTCGQHKFQLDTWFGQLKCSYKTIELMFSGINMLWTVWWESKNWKKWQQNSLRNISFANAVTKRLKKTLLDFNWLLTSYDYLILTFHWFISACYNTF